MKRGGPLRRSDKPMAPGGLPAATKAQTAVFDALVEQIGCAVCRFHLGIEDTPAEIHHLLEGQRRISHDYVIPLCAVHHRQGIQDHPSRHSVNGCHGGLHVFEETYGDEYSLLDQCEIWINKRYATGQNDDERDTSEADDSYTDTDADDQPDDGDARPEVERLQTFNTPVHIGVTHYRARLCDPDNLNAKGVIDAIVAAKILLDDSAKFVKSITHDQVKVKSYAEEKTIVTIQEAIT